MRNNSSGHSHEQKESNATIQIPRWAFENVGKALMNAAPNTTNASTESNTSPKRRNPSHAPQTSHSSSYIGWKERISELSAKPKRPDKSTLYLG